MTNVSTIGFLIGLILGFILGAFGGSLVRDDEIKAGAFQHNGVAYKIERIGQ